MRPRAEARGNRRVRVGDGAERVASMRPRAEARGNIRQRGEGGAERAGFNEASCRSTRKHIHNARDRGGDRQLQ